MPDDAFIAVDWGTTNRRCYRVEAGQPAIATERDDRGVLAIGQGEFGQEVTALRRRHGNLPVVMAGMIGSDRGWAVAPYVACPVSLAGLARALVWMVPGEVAIVPGASDTAGGRADVMRGEEVQLLGAVAAGLVPDGALLCQPGTHCKWARIEAGRIAGFTTTMTGEVFALLARHSLLAPQLEGPVEPDSDFLAGVARSGQGDLLAELFGARAAAVLGACLPRGASFVSGLLIGADVAARDGVAGGEVHVLAEPALGTLYAAAIAALGGTARPVDSQAAFVAGMSEIWRMRA